MMENISDGCQETFLNGDLHEEVYMTSPPGVAHQRSEVCRLYKAFYDLKEAPCAWFEKFSMAITSLVFFPNHELCIICQAYWCMSYLTTIVY